MSAAGSMRNPRSACNRLLRGGCRRQPILACIKCPTRVQPESVSSWSDPEGQQKRQSMPPALFFLSSVPRMESRHHLKSHLRSKVRAAISTLTTKYPPGRSINGSRTSFVDRNYSRLTLPSRFDSRRYYQRSFRRFGFFQCVSLNPYQHMEINEMQTFMSEPERNVNMKCEPGDWRKETHRITDFYSDRIDSWMLPPS